MPARLTPETIVAQAARLLGAASADGEVMLMHIDNGRYYNLNRVASRVWHLIESPRRVDDICRQLQSAFDVPPQVCEDDVFQLLSDLITEGLASVVEEHRAHLADS